MITQEQFNNYRGKVAGISENAEIYVRAMLEAFRRINPNSSIAEQRENAIEVMNEAVNLFGEQAAQASEEFFQDLAVANNTSVKTSTTQTIDSEITAGKIRTYVDALKKGDFESFVKNTSERAGYCARRNAFENMRDFCVENKIKYGRVPSIGDTCEFCIMLASRGFVYSTRAAAGEFHKYHVHCRCTVVPNFGDKQNNEVLEGYDPKEYYWKWEAIQRAKQAKVIERDLYIGNASDVQKEEQKIKKELSNLKKEYKAGKSLDKELNYNNAYQKWLKKKNQNLDVEPFTNLRAKEVQLAIWLAKKDYQILFRNDVVHKSTQDALMNDELVDFKRLKTCSENTISTELRKKRKTQGDLFLLDFSTQEIETRDAKILSATVMNKLSLEKMYVVVNRNLIEMK